MKRGTVLVFGLAAVFACAGSASAAWSSFFDDFESYANQAAFQAAWPAWSSNGSSMGLLQTFGYSGNQSVDGVAPGNNQVRNKRDFSSDLNQRAPSNALPATWSFWLYDDDPTMPLPPSYPSATYARNFCELRAYVGDGIPAYGTGTLQGLVAMGLYNTPVSDDNYHIRVYYGGVSAWYDTGKVRLQGWHKMNMIISGSQVKFWVDNDDANPFVVNFTDTSKVYAFDGIILGSGLTTGGYDVAFDDMYFMPEPATLVMLAAGGVLLRRRRSA